MFMEMLKIKLNVGTKYSKSILHNAQNSTISSTRYREILKHAQIIFDTSYLHSPWLRKIFKLDALKFSKSNFDIRDTQDLYL